MLKIPLEMYLLKQKKDDLISAIPETCQVKGQLKSQGQWYIYSIGVHSNKNLYITYESLTWASAQDFNTVKPV